MVMTCPCSLPAHDPLLAPHTPTVARGSRSPGQNTPVPRGVSAPKLILNTNLRVLPLRLPQAELPEAEVPGKDPHLQTLQIPTPTPGASVSGSDFPL